jgi:hypothetical protein
VSQTNESAVDLGTPIETRLTPSVVSERLLGLSKRGKLPGFEPAGEGGSSTAFGTPFDHRLRIDVEGSDAGSVVRLSVEPRWRMPVVFGVVLVLTVWPGEPLTDSLLRTYFTLYERWTQELLGGWFGTWLWYYPMTVPFVPLVFRAMLRRSRAEARVHAEELAVRIAAALSSE